VCTSEFEDESDDEVLLLFREPSTMFKQQLGNIVLPFIQSRLQRVAVESTLRINVGPLLKQLLYDLAVALS
jgi:hypothetical protein